MARAACTSESTVGMQTWSKADVQMWNACRRLGVLDQFMSPAIEQSCKYGPDAKRKLRRKRRAHNAALIAAAHEAEEDTALTTSYHLRSQMGPAGSDLPPFGEARPPSVESKKRQPKKRQRYESVPQPTEEQVAAFAPHGGAMGCFDRFPANHCGGDLYFTSLVLAEPACCHRRTGAYRHPFFPMMAGAAAWFESSMLSHGTAQHENVRCRSKGCKAHLSIAVQLPGDLLPGVATNAAPTTQLHAEVMDEMSADANEKWGDDPETVWLAVHKVEPEPQRVRLCYDEAQMCVLPFCRVVLYDAAAEPRKRVFVVYDPSGGLSAEEQHRVRGQFDWMHSGWKFDLERQSGSSMRGSLGYDGAGKQRMEMLGIRNRKWNKGKKGGPDRSRPSHAVRNRAGPLDAYVVHFDDQRFGKEQMKWLMNALSARMHSALPRTYGRLREALVEADLGKHLYSEDAPDFVSDDWVCSNIGLSAGYQSPPHCDVNDMGPCMAVAVKCPVREGMSARGPARECRCKSSTIT